MLRSFEVTGAEGTGLSSATSLLRPTALSSFSPFICFCLPHVVPAARISGVLPDICESSSSGCSSLVGQQLQRQKNIPAYLFLPWHFAGAWLSICIFVAGCGERGAGAGLGVIACLCVLTHF